MQMLRLKIVPHFLHVQQILMTPLLIKQIIFALHNLIEYSDNYSDRSGSLWQFKRDEAPAGNVDLTIDNLNIHLNIKQLF